MLNIEQDVKELVWAMETFQKCVPEQYRMPIEVLVAKYYIAHPSDDTIRKIVSILWTGKKDSRDNEIDEKKGLRYYIEKEEL